jgi:hypothetical protein
MPYYEGFHIIRRCNDMENYRKTINVEGNKIKRQATVIKEIALSSARVILEDEKVYALAGTVGLMQGLKYNGSFKRGVKGGLATMGVMVGANVIRNMVSNLDVIKDA